MEIFCIYKKNTAFGSLNLETSEVVYNGKSFKNPTSAASAVMMNFGGGRHLTANGWKFWKYNEKDGKIKPISVLRLKKENSIKSSNSFLKVRKNQEPSPQ